LGGARRAAEADLAARRARLTLRQRQRALTDSAAANSNNGSNGSSSSVADLPPLSLPDLARVPNPAAEFVPGGYLSPAAAAFRRIFLYHSAAEAGLEGRATTALFFLDGLNDADPAAPPPVDQQGLQVLPAARVAVWFTNPVCIYTYISAFVRTHVLFS
jgi:hypothetical protein